MGDNLEIFRHSKMRRGGKIKITPKAKTDQKTFLFTILSILGLSR